LILTQSAPKCAWWFGFPTDHWRSYVPRVGIGRKWKRKEGGCRGLSDVSDRDETITGWWGDK